MACVTYVYVCSVLQQIEAHRDGATDCFMVAAKRGCSPRAVAELLSYWDGKGLDSLDQWLVGVHPGLSSESLVFHVTGRLRPSSKLDCSVDRFRGSVPTDPDSFRRCVTAVDAISGAMPFHGMDHCRDTLPAVWGPYIDRWEDLERSHRAKDYESVQSLLDMARRAGTRQ